MKIHKDIETSVCFPRSILGRAAPVKMTQLSAPLSCCTREWFAAGWTGTGNAGLLPAFIQSTCWDTDSNQLYIQQYTALNFIHYICLYLAVTHTLRHKFAVGVKKDDLVTWLIFLWCGATITCGFVHHYVVSKEMSAVARRCLLLYNIVRIHLMAQMDF